jgi:hypothetical protein
MMLFHKFEAGEKVLIIGGSFQEFKMGTYLRRYGLKMACIAVDGDKQKERNVRLSSIAPVRSDKADKRQADEASTDFIRVNRKDYYKLLEDVSDLAEALARLEVRVRKLAKV